MPKLMAVTDREIDALVDDINEVGFGVLPGYVSQETLLGLRDFVDRTVEAAGHEYVGLTGKSAVAGSLLDALSDNVVFVDLIKAVYEKGTRHDAPKQSLYQVLRCLIGRSGLKHSLFFHYDSYVVTALLPIAIPTSGNTGQLVMLPNWRGVRRTYFQNLLDKLLLDNKLTQRILGDAFLKKRRWLKEVTLVPGNLYFFWGYRTIHANAACDPDQLRATALFHFGDPHATSVLRRFTGRAKLRAAVVQ